MAVAWQTRGDTWVRLSIRLLFKRHNAAPGIRRIQLMPASRRLHDLQKFSQMTFLLFVKSPCTMASTQYNYLGSS